MREPILITGAARSRTSMCAGIIHFSGAFGGNMTGPTPYNKKGQFENNHIRDHITKPYLKHMGLDPKCQHPLPDSANLIRYPGLYTEVKTAMIHQGYKEGPWFYKGAKMCLLWPLWHEAFPKARWVVIRRPTREIAESCVRTPFMRAFHNVDGWLRWVEVHERRFEEMKAAGLDVTEVWSGEIVNGNYDAIRGFVEETEGLSWRDSKVRDFVAPELTKELAKEER